MNYSNWAKNLSISSIWTLNAGLLWSSFLSEASNKSKLTLISFDNIFSLCSWVATSTPTATPSSSF